MKKAFLVAALIAALVLSGCIMPTPDSTGVEQSQGIIPSENQQPTGQQQDNQQPSTQQPLVQCPDGSMAASADLCIGSPEQPLINPGVESCGSIDITNLAMATGSVEEKADLACFNQNMAACINSTFELTGQFGGLFSVLGEEGDNCLISYYDNTDYVQKTCKFPKSFVESSVQSATEANQPELPLILISGGLSGKQYADSVTGEPFEIECN